MICPKRQFAEQTLEIMGTPFIVPTRRLGRILMTIPDLSRVFLVTKFGKTLYSQQAYEENDYFVFGRETSGLPEEIRNQFPIQIKFIFQ